MTLESIYNGIKKYEEMEKKDMYDKIIKYYSKNKVNFVMYDLFKYVHVEMDYYCAAIYINYLIMKN